MFENERATGFSVEMMRELAKIAGWDLQIVQAQNPAESMALLSRGEADIHPNLVPNDERGAFLEFTETITVGSVVAIIDPSRVSVSSLDETHGLRFGYQKGSIASFLIPDQTPYTPVEQQSNAEMMLAFLDGRLDGVITIEHAFLRRARLSGFEERTAVLTPSLREIPVAIAVSKASPGLYAETQAALATLRSSPRFAEMRHGWFGSDPENSDYGYFGWLVGLSLFSLCGILVWQWQSGARARARAAERLRKAVNQVLNSATNGIIGLGRDGTVEVINPAARHMFGGINTPTPFPLPKEINFLDAGDLTPIQSESSPIRRALAGEMLHGETNIMARSNERAHRYVRVTSSTVDSPDTSIHTVLVVDDVSEQEIARQQVERASRLDALGQLTGGIAHDFNNLLATIQYSIELAIRRAADNEMSDLLDMALNSVNRGAALSRRLLAFARQQPGLSESRNLAQIRDDFLALVTPTIEKRIKVEFVLERENLWVYCDQAQLENSLLNLVLNARDAIVRSGRGDSIIISAQAVTGSGRGSALIPTHPHSYRAAALTQERHEDNERHDDMAYRYVEIAVTDNGPGMPDEVKRRAIDPFFSTKDTNSGTGLGLSIVYGFVQQAGGELRLYSELEQGTSVQLMLPRGTPEGRREQRVKREVSVRGSGESILVVEDEVFLLDLLIKTLESLGYVPTAAGDSHEALEILTEHGPFDLMITDIVMPSTQSGFELAAQARKLYPAMPVIYMSGYTGYRENQMGEVVAPLLPKPCPEAKLAKMIRDVLEGGTGH